ncbi:M81 family metallopeptidase [Sphingopyxis macrogoltabida]|uniref:Microcystinase C n=1 Tax=Sphingopyxis macrogoltabida TaxID=33050 RepID=A0A0N9V1K1_SPHMC|nr:M81 family metallopeptidase [Sphingopyxis macrogoltabida]ALH82193.1 hypothetical protein AN936_18085 [Sphingopyxis macrogoltabida]
MTDESRPLRIFVAGLMHETNGFSPIPTSIGSFEADLAYIPPSDNMRELALNFAGYGDAVRAVRDAGNEPIEGPCFWAQPSGPISAAVYAKLKHIVLDALSEAGPIDAVLLVLHGAMIAEGFPDCEADLLEAVREAAGREMPVGGLLDLHGNVSEAMVKSGALLVGVKEYPHVDYPERARELHDMLVELAGGACMTMTLRTIPWLSLQGTVEQPMRGFVDRMIEAESADGIRSVTLMHGFPWADWAHAGASVLVVSQGANAEAASALAEDLADAFVPIADGAPTERLSIADAIDTALSARGKGPVVIADSSDNPGGGAACDSTFLLRELIERGCGNAAVGMIWDPQAAQIAADAGVGTKLRLRIGGKVSAMSGDPVDLECEVLAVRDDVKQRMFSAEPNVPIGLSAALRAGGIKIVVNSIRQQVFDPDCFLQMGVELVSKQLVVVKSSQHFRALFDPIAQTTLYCDAPGSLSLDFAKLPYQSVKLARSRAGFVSAEPVIRVQQAIAAPH